MNNAPPAVSFGCQRCWPASAHDAWTARASLSHEATLVEEPHFIVSLQSCPDCAQRFISVFIETISWTGDNDRQGWVRYPVTVDEAARLTDPQAPLTHADLDGLDRDRRSLIRGVAASGQSTCDWSTGLSVGWHD